MEIKSKENTIKKVCKNKICSYSWYGECIHRTVINGEMTCLSVSR